VCRGCRGRHGWGTRRSARLNPDVELSQGHSVETGGPPSQHADLAAAGPSTFAAMQCNNSPDLDRMHSALADFAIMGRWKMKHTWCYHCTHAPLQAVRGAFPDLQPVLEEGSLHALLSHPPQLVARFLQQCFEAGDYESLPYWGKLDNAAVAGGDV
jgi:hypothetical protein